jgi:arylsulfatase A-like enzyme
MGMSNIYMDRRSFLKLGASAALAGLTYPLTRFLGDNSQPPNILVLVFDALSARNMALYGYPRQNTPNLERFAQRATVFHQHHSTGSFTTPGTASMLTGVYPWDHRALQLYSQALPPFSDQNIFGLLPPAYSSFAYTQNPNAYILLDQFRQHIGALPPIGALADYSAAWAESLFPKDYYPAYRAEYALERGGSYKLPASLWLSLFKFWRMRRGNRLMGEALLQTYPYGPVSCDQKVIWTQCFQLETAVNWTIDQAQFAKRPFLGYVHYFPPHPPYNPRVDFTQLFDDDYHAPEKPPFYDKAADIQQESDQKRRLYDQFIAHVDSEFGRLYVALENSGVLDDTCLVVTSDHGELFERGIIGHAGPPLYEPLLHIPLLISLPGQQERQDITTPTSAVSLLPTLLNLSGVRAPNNIESGILPGFASQPASSEGAIYALDAESNPRNGPLRQFSACVIRWPYKLIAYHNYPKIPNSFELYNLADDPDELNNLYTPGDALASGLKAELEQKLDFNT